MTENSVVETENLSSEVELTPSLVKQFLLVNPDFFQEEQALLQSLKISHSSGKAISLLEYQMELLRKKLCEMEEEFNHMLIHARENELLLQNTLTFSLQLLETENFAALSTIVQQSIPTLFQVDIARLWIMQKRPKQPNPDVIIDVATLLREEKIWLGDSKPRCGLIPKSLKHRLFQSDANRVASTAIIPIPNVGVLALGSEDSKRFYEGMGTVFLNFIQGILKRKLTPDVLKTVS